LEKAYSFDSIPRRIGKEKLHKLRSSRKWKRVKNAGGNDSDTIDMDKMVFSSDWQLIAGGWRGLYKLGK